MHLVPVLVVFSTLLLSAALGLLVEGRTSVSLAKTEAPTPPTLVLSRSYDAGMHHFDGLVSVPDACHTATVSTQVNETSVPSVIALAIVVVGDEGICLELPTGAPFTASVAAPEEADVLVVINGVSVTPMRIEHD